MRFTTGRGARARRPAAGRSVHGATAAPRGARGTRTTATLAAATCALLATRAARAQVVLGAGDDATIPAPGEVRVRVTPAFNSSTSRLGGPTGRGGPRVPLGSEYSTDAFGTTQLPRLGPVLDTLRAITGVPALGLSLGTVNVRARVSTADVPTLVEYGVFRRFAVALTFPGVITHTSVGVAMNEGEGSGNFGLNPVRVSTTAQAAATRNATAIRAFDGAITQLRAQGAGSAALANEVQRVRDGIAAVYGNGASGANALPGAPVVPLVGSDAQTALVTRINQLVARGAPLPTDGSALPAASQARIGTLAFLNLLTSSDLGIGGGRLSPLGSYRRSGPGDVDAVANLQLLDTFGGEGTRGRLRARVAPHQGVRVRATVGAGWRVGLGAGRIPFILFDVPPSEHMSGLLARAATDVAVGRRFSTSAVVRLASPVSDRVTIRITDPGQPYAAAYRVRDVGRRLGRELELEVTPRYALNDAFALFAQGFVRDRADTRYTGTFTATADETGLRPDTFDASGLGVGTGGRETRAAFGAAYSTIAGVARGRGRIPVELSYQHAFLAAASGGTVQNVTTDQLSIRVSARLFGR